MQRQELESSLMAPTQPQTPAKVLNSSPALKDTEFILCALGIYHSVMGTHVSNTPNENHDQDVTYISLCPLYLINPFSSS